MTLFEENEALVALEWGQTPEEGSSSLLFEARNQLTEYFDGGRMAFDLPFRLRGTPFQQSVWKLMGDIPFGDTRTYGDLASDLHSAPRSVGGACGRNPLPIIIPCHRVLAGTGLGGYSGGGGANTKRLLLRLEGALA